MSIVRAFAARLVETTWAERVVTAMPESIDEAARTPVPLEAYDDQPPALYVYRQESRSRSHLGLVCDISVEAFADGRVRGHEAVSMARVEALLDHLATTTGPPALVALLHHAGPAYVRMITEVVRTTPVLDFVTADGVRQTVWTVPEGELTAEVAEEVGAARLYIADGHHRYETALAFSKENPGLPGADRVMMTFVNMNSPGLTILATHRLVRGLPLFDAPRFLASIPARNIGSAGALKQIFSQPDPDHVRIGIAIQGSAGIYLFEKHREPGELDVQVLHRDLLDGKLGISDADVREEKNLFYVRGIDPAVESVAAGQAQLAFLLEPVTIEQVAGVAFSGGVMPQKSTDFYPKLLSGLTIYKLD